MHRMMPLRQSSSARRGMAFPVHLSACGAACIPSSSRYLTLDPMEGQKGKHMCPACAGIISMCVGGCSECQGKAMAESLLSDGLERGTKRRRAAVRLEVDAYHEIHGNGARGAGAAQTELAKTLRLWYPLYRKSWQEPADEKCIFAVGVHSYSANVGRMKRD